MRRRSDAALHAVLLAFLAITMTPFLFVVNNSLRTQSEHFRTFFGIPASISNGVGFTWQKLTGKQQFELVVPKAADTPTATEPIEPTNSGGFVKREFEYRPAMAQLWASLTKGYRHAWRELRPYMLNTLLVSAATVAGVLLLGSISGYVFSRYRFPMRGVLFTVLLSIIMIPPVLTLVPAFLLVKKLNLLNSHWVLILPYVAGGQIVAIFLFKSFFDGLPEELFESARLEGAGHFAIYRHLVLPLSKQVAAVVAVMNILGVWNNFMWPFITNTDTRYHVVASGLYLMSEGATGQNYSAMFAAFVLSSIPLIVLFTYATRPFMQGVTSGAFKA